jgi:hypothetical protein
MSAELANCMAHALPHGSNIETLQNPDAIHDAVLATTIYAVLHGVHMAA